MGSTQCAIVRAAAGFYHEHTDKEATVSRGRMETNRMYLTQALHRAAQQHPDRVAVRFGNRQRTFREFADRVARLAGALRKLGMQTGDRVAMLSLNSDRYLEYQMAVPWAGGVLNPCNIRWSAAEILYSLNDSGSIILLVDEAFRPMIEQFRRDSSTLREVVYCGDGDAPCGMHGYEALLAGADPMADALRRGEDLAGIFYTGGTTGFPKGVMLSHTNLCSSGLALRAEGLATPGGTYLHAAPMFHLADMGIAVPHWVEGNTHSIIPAFNPELVLDTLERDRVTHLLLVPTMIQMLVGHPAMTKPRDLSALQTIAYGASPISEAVLERAMAALPGVGFVQAYGMTELSPLATVNPAWYHTPEARKLGKLRSAGRASFITEVSIVDPLGNEVPRGTVGEVVVRGPNVMQGYWNKPELTAAAVRDGWMHTGDGAWMDDDGFIFIADRLKDMIISGGENIYSAEVENALAQHPAVAACAVIGVPSDEWGESVHAMVVRNPEQALSAEQLIAHCRSLIAGYKCPRSVDFVAALPLSGAGKVLKTKLREPFWQGRERTVA
jgi:acyl-CoA synthetase (AMP-forming)/AMP-acid ligase II